MITSRSQDRDLVAIAAQRILLVGVQVSVPSLSDVTGCDEVQTRWTRHLSCEDSCGSLWAVQSPHASPNGPHHIQPQPSACCPQSPCKTPHRGFFMLRSSGRFFGFQEALARSVLSNTLWNGVARDMGLEESCPGRDISFALARPNGAHAALQLL